MKLIVNGAHFKSKGGNTPATSGALSSRLVPYIPLQRPSQTRTRTSVLFRMAAMAQDANPKNTKTVPRTM